MATGCITGALPDCNINLHLFVPDPPFPLDCTDSAQTLQENVPAQGRAVVAQAQLGMKCPEADWDQGCDAVFFFVFRLRTRSRTCVYMVLKCSSGGFLVSDTGLTVGGLRSRIWSCTFGVSWSRWFWWQRLCLHARLLDPVLLEGLLRAAYVSRRISFDRTWPDALGSATWVNTTRTLTPPLTT